ncbi:hypothetical protein BUALT_Bualt02G0189900 [Buddleja alternifolia]|uniref:Beta-glucosidase n=1 Tax=Buddleja alternifolia TaxID=168488 RepID=A0AAV6Y8K5_9LAMI|nr:hypothetical protein BUALT_Bualt02G0189900 [Buddleja alternifolia]
MSVTGEFAPGEYCGGDSGVEPYLVAHHQLLAHAAAVKIYKEKYQLNEMASPLVRRYFSVSHKLFSSIACVGEKRTLHSGASNWLYVYPKGIRDVLLYVKKTYKNPTIYITENGIDETNNSTLSLQEALIDNMRIEKGVDVKGFFAWALTNNFEWSSGYSLRFGLNYVDYEDGLKRYPKLSARWFRQFLQH